MSISFFDESHKKILEERCKLGLNQFWTDKKTVKIDLFISQHLQYLCYLVLTLDANPH